MWRFFCTFAVTKIVSKILLKQKIKTPLHVNVGDFLCLNVKNNICITKKLPKSLRNYNFFVTFASAIKPKSSYK